MKSRKARQQPLLTWSALPRLLARVRRLSRRKCQEIEASAVESAPLRLRWRQSNSRALARGTLHWTRYKIKAPAAKAAIGTQKWMSWKIGLSQDLISGSLLRYGIIHLRTTRRLQTRLVAGGESRPNRTPRSNRLGVTVYTSSRSAVNLCGLRQSEPEGTKVSENREILDAKW